MNVDRNSSVLVTGGRGFIGRTVAKLLRRKGYSVVSLDASPVSSAAAPVRESVREVVGDITDVAQLQRIFEIQPFGGIVHLAAILPTAAQLEPLRATQVNVDGGVNLLEMARRFEVRRMVFGSSLSVYGTCAADRIVSEAGRAAPEDLYGAAKLYVERLGEVYRGRHGLEFVSLRIGRVVGPGAQSATSAWRSQIFELLGTTHPTEILLPYIGSERILLAHVDDVSRMLVDLLGAPRLEHAIYNAPCESVVVANLKGAVEALNANINIELGTAYAVVNPRLLDFSCFQREYGFAMAQIVEQLRTAAGK